MELRGRAANWGRREVKRYIAGRLKLKREDRRLALTIIANKFTKRLTTREIDKKHEVTRYHRENLDRDIEAALKALRERAKDSLHKLFQEGGLLP
jgi:hypothetical protein